MELIKISNIYDNKKDKYFIITDKEIKGIITNIGDENIKVIINDLSSFNENNKNLFFTRNNFYLIFSSNSLIKNIDIQKLNEVLSIYKNYKIHKIKISGYLTNDKGLQKEINFPNIQYLSINNLLYTNFNLFDYINLPQLQCFKLNNYKFSTNQEIESFFIFLHHKKVKNLILKNIFIEILENNSDDDSNEYGIINTYLEYNGNKISFHGNNLNKSSFLENLYLENCKLLFIDFDKYSSPENKLYLTINNNCILNENDSILKFKYNENGISISLNGENEIKNSVWNLLKNQKIFLCEFINFSFYEELKKINLKLNCPQIKFKECSYLFINEVLSNMTNSINYLSIKDSIEEKNNYKLIINNEKLFSSNDIKIVIQDSNIEIYEMNYNILKVSFYEKEYEDLKNNQTLFSLIFEKEHNELVIKGMFFQIIPNKNYHIKAKKITFDNILINESIETNIKNSNIIEKELTFLNSQIIIFSKEKTNIDYFTFNFFLYSKNEINDFLDLINLLLYEENKTKVEETLKQLNQRIQPFYNQNICFYYTNHIELRNIILSLFCLNDNQPNIKTILENYLAPNILPNTEDNIKIISDYYFSPKQIQFIEGLKISFKKIKKQK